MKRIALVSCTLSIAWGMIAQTPYDSPASILPDTWTADETDVFVQTLPVEDKWWLTFEDSTLDSLIAIAIENNYNIETALTRMEEARINLHIERGNLLPDIGVSGGWNRQQSSGNTGSSTSWSSQYNLKANMNWEIDLRGSILGRIKAGKEQVMVSQEEYNGVMVSLCAQVATSYFSLRQYQMELEVLDHNCESQRAVVQLTEARNSAGLASKLDVAQAQQVYYGTLAQVPAMEANIIHATGQLAVLLGQTPAAIRPWLEKTRPLPSYIEIVTVDVPAALLRRRPDIRAAERQVNVQAALAGAATRDWLPQFFINGSIGFASTALKDLPHHGSLTWEIAPSMSWTLFNGGKRYNNVRLNRAKLNESISQYNQTVLQAMQEVSSSMATYSNSIKQIVSTRQAFNYSEKALALSLDLYKQGLTTFQSVLDAQRSLLSYEESLVQAKAYSLISLVKMYQAFGGGWSEN